jgi:xanthine/CO dehydrogenase XdhC/CoxF family maturation factor
MTELLRVAAALDRAARDRQVSVLATVVRTEGSTYRRIGARLVAFPDGSHVGAVSAGCIETAVLLRAEEVRSAGVSVLLTYDTRTPEDHIWGYGAGCGGLSELLLEPLDPGPAAAKAERLREVAQLHGPSVLVTVIRAAGLAVEPGDQAVLLHESPGLIGFDELPAEARAGVEATARQHLLARTSAAVLQVGVDSELDLAYEVCWPRLRFCVCGAGPDAAPLVAMAKLMGWQVTLIDHRPALLSPEDWPDVERILLSSPLDAAELAERAGYDAAVVMSHSYEHDRTQVGALLAAGVAYIGVLGPRRRTLQMIEDLGVSERDGPRLYAPVGLDIGADTPDEIALAIVAEVQAVRSGRRGGPLRERTSAIHDEAPEPAVSFGR